MILRILANMFFWTVIKGSVRDSLKRGDRGVRRRVYMYLALCVLGVLLLSACRDLDTPYGYAPGAQYLGGVSAPTTIYIFPDTARGVTCYYVSSVGISCVRTRP